MDSPYRIDSPTAISMSGGRTSAYMLHRILEANGGLPDEAVVLFANTGKEDEATLRFVRDIGDRWEVSIEWVEFRDDELGYEVVEFETASRAGEPFEALIRKRKFLPNPVARFCTSELKIRTMHRWLRTNRPQWTDLDQMIGIRADEHRRVAKIRARGHSTESSHETMLMPLADAGVTVQEVGAFWAAQPFNLELPTNAQGRTTAGNCDLCFLKPPAQRLSLVRERPERVIWWARMEASVTGNGITHGLGDRFTKDGPSYAEIADYADRQADMFDAEEEALACFCGE